MQDYQILVPDFKKITMPKHYYLGIEFVKKMKYKGSIAYPNMYQMLEHIVTDTSQYVFVLSYIDYPIIQYTAKLSDVLMILPCGIATFVEEQEFLRLQKDRLKLLTFVKQETIKAEADWKEATGQINKRIAREESKKDVESRTESTAASKRGRKSSTESGKQKGSKKTSKKSTL